MMNKFQLLDEAPDFTKVDAHDQPVSLSDFRGKQTVYLVFNRGFACPFCRRHMMHLRQDYDLFKQRNTEILTLGPNSPQEFKRFWASEKMQFIGMSDAGSETADLYMQEVHLLKLGRMPAVFVIDPQGLIRYMHYASSMADIPANEDILRVIDGLGEQSIKRRPISLGMQG